jgi:hypothetical protein
MDRFRRQTSKEVEFGFVTLTSEKHRHLTIAWATNRAMASITITPILFVSVRSASARNTSAMALALTEARDLSDHRVEMSPEDCANASGNHRRRDSIRPSRG